MPHAKPLNRLTLCEPYRSRGRLLRALLKTVSIALLVAPFGCVSSLAQSLSPQEELFNRPAAVSPRASKSVLLSISNAGNRLVAVGEAGYVVLSDDDGRTWRQAKVPSSVALTKVYFSTESVGWAVGHGGVVLHTEDGGNTWAKQLDGLQLIQIEQKGAESELDSNSRVARLEEVRRLAMDGADKPLFDVYFGNDGRGYVVGAYGLAFFSPDGGKSWTSLRGRIPNPKGKHLYAIHVSGADVFVAGEQGAVY